VYSRFSDRDLFMHYRGGGVGHLATQKYSKILLADKHMDPQDMDTTVHELAENEDGGSEDEDDRDVEVDCDEDDELEIGNMDDTSIVNAVGFGSL